MVLALLLACAPPAPPDPVAALRPRPVAYTQHARCRMDCRPHSHAETGHADDVTVHDSWMSTADDGSGTPQLNVKMEHTQPILDRIMWCMLMM
jgi:hypothetical protein